MTPEGKVKLVVGKALLSAGAYKHMPVQNGMGAPALDYHVCHRGIYAAIETKALGKPLTVRQVRTMKEVKAAGGALFVIDDTKGDDIAQLQGWLMHPIPGFISHLAEVYLTTRIPDGDTRDD